LALTRFHQQVLKHKLNIYGNETKGFHEFVSPHKERLKNAVEKFIEAKKAIQIAMKLSYTAFRYKLYVDQNKNVTIT
jgi:hypothetical protein